MAPRLSRLAGRRRFAATDQLLAQLASRVRPSWPSPAQDEMRPAVRSTLRSFQYEEMGRLL